MSGAWTPSAALFCPAMTFFSALPALLGVYEYRSSTAVRSVDYMTWYRTGLNGRGVLASTTVTVTV